MEPTSPIGPRVMFVAGLMDWVGEAPPTASAIAGRKVIDQGNAHYKSILQTGGQVLGCRELDDDGLVAERHPGSTWGLVVIARRAERIFVGT